MKKYYVSSVVKYYDISDDYEGEEIYTFFVRARNDKSGLKRAFENTLNLFLKDFGENEKITGINIDEFYETTDDARI